MFLNAIKKGLSNFEGWLMMKSASNTILINISSKIYKMTT